MAQYIDKAALVAEIKRRIDRDNENAASFSSGSEHDYLCRVKEAVYKDLLSFLDTLEVKEVDLEKALDNFYKQEDWSPTDAIEYDTHKDIARHFFVLGLNARKKEYNYEIRG